MRPAAAIALSGEQNQATVNPRKERLMSRPPGIPVFLFWAIPALILVAVKPMDGGSSGCSMGCLTHMRIMQNPHPALVMASCEIS